MRGLGQFTGFGSHDYLTICTVSCTQDRNRHSLEWEAPATERCATPKDVVEDYIQ